MSKLKELRKSKGFMGAFVAEKLGISLRQYQKIEKGDCKLSDKRVEVMSKVIGASETEIKACLNQEKKAIQI